MLKFAYSAMCLRFIVVSRSRTQGSDSGPDMPVTRQMAMSERSERDQASSQMSRVIIPVSGLSRCMALPAQFHYLAALQLDSLRSGTGVNHFYMEYC